HVLLLPPTSPGDQVIIRFDQVATLLQFCDNRCDLCRREDHPYPGREPSCARPVAPPDVLGEPMPAMNMSQRGPFPLAVLSQSPAVEGGLVYRKPTKSFLSGFLLRGADELVDTEVASPSFTNPLPELLPGCGFHVGIPKRKDFQSFTLEEECEFNL